MKPWKWFALAIAVAVVVLIIVFQPKYDSNTNQFTYATKEQRQATIQKLKGKIPGVGVRTSDDQPAGNPEDGGSSTEDSGDLSKDEEAKVTELLERRANHIFGEPGPNHKGLRIIEKGQPVLESSDCRVVKVAPGPKGKGKLKRVECDGSDSKDD